MIDPVAAQQARRDLIERPVRDPLTFADLDDGARLDTPENHRAKAIEKMSGDNDKAEQTALKARAWAISIGYHPEYVKKVNEAIEALGEAAELIDRYETADVVVVGLAWVVLVVTLYSCSSRARTYDDD